MKGKAAEEEGSAWGVAAEWSKNILDLSARPFAFGGTLTDNQSACSHEEAKIQPTAETPLQASVSLPKDYKAPLNIQASFVEYSYRFSIQHVRTCAVSIE